MSDIDDKLATTWRSASREQPPAALDATLRAAARRAVHAGPVRTRHMHTWPLAAAAVVAVLAVGILQLTPPQEVTPGLVGDSAPRQAQAPSLRLASASAPPAETAAPAPAPGHEPGDNSPRAVPSAPMRDGADVPQQVAQGPSASPAPVAGRLTAKSNVAPATDSAKLRARADAEQSTQAKLAAESDARVVAAAPAPRAEPFPAAGVGASRAESGADRGSPAGALAAAPASPPATASELAKREAAANAMPTEESQGRAQPLMTGIAPAQPEQMKDAAIRPPEEWVKLIRRLKSEGRNDEAAKELAAFRTAYGERADALLPADLRAARP